MTFPTPWVLAHKPYTGLALDALNKEVPAWDAPVDVRVISYRVKNTEALVAGGQPYTSRQVREAVICTPPGLVVNVRDRFVVPDSDGPSEFEVYDVSDLSHGFHGWNPGKVVKAKRITPAGTVVPV